MTEYEHARRYRDAGISVIPIRLDGTKTPAVRSWSEYKGPSGRLATDEELTAWWGVSTPPGIAALGGCVSGGLELIDFDRDADLTFPAWREMVSEAFDEDLMARLCVVRTPREPAGFHVWFRWAGPVPGNAKLAMLSEEEQAAEKERAKRESDRAHLCLIETRGEGGYALVPGCPPACHETGRPYVHVSGPMLWDLAPLTADERESLMAFAHSLDRQRPAPDAVPKSKPGLDLRPGDAFDRDGWDWADVLEPHGWTLAGRAGDERRWARPGKKRGWSATTGHCASGGADLLRVFSSSADPFDEGKAYGKFRAFALLNCGGNLSEAARTLRQHGFGSPNYQAARKATPRTDAPPDEEKARRVATIDDLIRAGSELTWLWPGWLQQGVVVAIASEGGMGKTRLCADLVRRVRHGLPWPDGTAMTLPPESQALWLLADNHHDEMVTLCRDLKINDVVRPSAWSDDPFGGVTLDSEGDYGELELRVQQVRPAFVIVDTVGNATDRNLSRQEDARAFYAPLQVLARRYRTCVLALTHLNASGKFLGRRVMEKVRVAIRLEKPDPDDPRRALDVVKSNSRTPKALGVRMTDDGNDYDDTPPKAPAPTDEPGQHAGRNGQVGRPATAAPTVMEWLREHLTSGPVRVSVLRTEADARGWSAPVLYRARDAVRAAETTEAGYKWWSLNGSADEPTPWE